MNNITCWFFFANVKKEVRNILHDQMRNNGIKWYLSIQVKHEKDSHKEKTSKPHFRIKTYASLNINTFDEQELNESFQKMFESLNI